MRYRVTGVMRFPPYEGQEPQEWEWHTFVTEEGPEEALLSILGLYEHRDRLREEVTAWCQEMIAPHLWRINQSDTIFISRAEDAVAFRMKWA